MGFWDKRGCVNADGDQTQKLSLGWLVPRVIAWQWQFALEWSRFIIWFRPFRWSRCKKKVYLPEEAPKSGGGICGSPLRRTRAVLIYFGPFQTLAESKRPDFSSACLPWGASW